MTRTATITFAGQSVSITSKTMQLLGDCTIMFGHHAQETPEVTDAAISIEVDDGVYTISSEVRDGDVPVKTFTELGGAMFELRDRVQYYLAKDQSQYLIVHAGAATYNDTTYVYPAASGSGKTTLSAWFIGQGATLLSDELVAVSRDGMVSGYAQTLNVKQGGEAAFYAALGKSEDELNTIKQPRGHVFVGWKTKAALNNWRKLACFLLPNYLADCEEAVLETVSPATVAAVLLENTINLRNFEKMGLPVVKSLVTSFEAKKAVYKDLADLGL